jgi:hypothetical protein
MKESAMAIEGPQDSPEGAPSTGLLATEPLPPQADDIREVVDQIDKRIRQAGAEDVEQAEASSEEADAAGDDSDPVEQQDSDEAPAGEPTG